MTSRMRMGLAGVAGVLSAALTVAVVEWIAHWVYAPATMPDVPTPAAMEAYIGSMPLGAFLFVLVAYLAGTMVGGVVAAAIARRHAMRFALIVGGVILAAGAANFVALPHPTWFVVATLVAVPAAAWLTGTATQRWAPA